MDSTTTTTPLNSNSGSDKQVEVYDVVGDNGGRAEFDEKKNEDVVAESKQTEVDAGDKLVEAAEFDENKQLGEQVAVEEKKAKGLSEDVVAESKKGEVELEENKQLGEELVVDENKESSGLNKAGEDDSVEDNVGKANVEVKESESLKYDGIALSEKNYGETGFVNYGEENAGKSIDSSVGDVVVDNKPEPELEADANGKKVEPESTKHDGSAQVELSDISFVKDKEENEEKGIDYSVVGENTGPVSVPDKPEPEPEMESAAYANGKAVEVVEDGANLKSGQGDDDSVVNVEEPLEVNKSDNVESEPLKYDGSAQVELSERDNDETGVVKDEEENAEKGTDSSVDDVVGESTGPVSIPDDEESKPELESAADANSKTVEVVEDGVNLSSGQGDGSLVDADVEEPFQLKSDKVKPESTKHDGSAQVELSEQNEGDTGFVKDDEQNVDNSINSSVEENREGKESVSASVEGDLALSSKVEKSDKDIEEEFIASVLEVYEAEEVALSGTDAGTGNLEEISGKSYSPEFDVAEEHHENGGTRSATSNGENVFSGMTDGVGKEDSAAESVSDSEVKQKERTLETHVAAEEPTSVATYDTLEKDIEEEFVAAVSHINDAGEVTPLETNADISSEKEVSVKSHLPEFTQEMEVQPNAGDIEKQYLDEDDENRASGTDYDVEDGSYEHSQMLDGEIVTESDEEAESEEDGNGNELFDSAALTALLKAATGGSSDGGGVTITSEDGTRLFSIERPAGLGSSLRSLKPASRPIRPNIFTSSNLTSGRDSENLSVEEKSKLEKLQQIRIKFLRLLHKLGYSSEDSMAGQVLYRLELIGGMRSGQLFNLESAKTIALQLESGGKDDIDFSLNILVIGKSGTGKSATINSIFGEEMSHIHAFEPATNVVREIVGYVDGIKIRIIDTPGLRSSALDQSFNRNILSSVKKFTKKCPPDVVLFVDRLDTQTKDLNDLPLLKSITSSLGPSIWRNAIVTLTHGASAPPDGPSGSPLSYEVFVAQRSHVLQQCVSQAVGDLRMMNPSMMNPVSLVENHPSCRKNRDGQKVLPNGQTWRPQLLLLCYSLKILSEANSLSKAPSQVDQKKLFGFRVRSPPLPYLLSWLLQSRTHPKLPADQGIDNGDSDVDLSDAEEEDDEDEYDQLPPFMPLKKAQLANLSKEQQNAYFEEYDYRVKLLQKKQWKEELNRIREIKKRKQINPDAYSSIGEDVEQDDGAPATVPVPLPDMVLPHSFDSDNPAYRYRFLEPTSQLLARPVLDTHGWDHDCGYDGVNVEQSLAIASRFPAALAIQLTKDKKEFNIHLDSSVATKHRENASIMAGFDIQQVGKQLGYTIRGETKFKNLKRNKTAAGISVTFLGESIAPGFKLEDQIAIGKRLMLVGSAGTVRSQGDAAYGTNLEVRLKEADYPVGQNQSSLALSLVKWRGDLALGANLSSQFAVGRGSKIAVRAGLNNKRSGQISIRTSSSDQLQIALIGIIPVAMTLYKTIRPGVSDNYSLY